VRCLALPLVSRADHGIAGYFFELSMLAYLADAGRPSGLTVDEVASFLVPSRASITSLVWDKITHRLVLSLRWESIAVPSLARFPFENSDGAWTSFRFLTTLLQMLSVVE
jgi:hypothetical protein